MDRKTMLAGLFTAGVVVAAGLFELDRRRDAPGRRTPSARLAGEPRDLADPRRFMFACDFGELSSLDTGLRPNPLEMAHEEFVRLGRWEDPQPSRAFAPAHQPRLARPKAPWIAASTVSADGNLIRNDRLHKHLERLDLGARRLSNGFAFDLVYGDLGELYAWTLSIDSVGATRQVTITGLLHGDLGPTRDALPVRDARVTLSALDAADGDEVAFEFEIRYKAPIGGEEVIRGGGVALLQLPK